MTNFPRIPFPWEIKKGLRRSPAEAQRARKFPVHPAEVLIAAGLRNCEIAKKLGISQQRVLQIRKRMRKIP